MFDNVLFEYQAQLLQQIPTEVHRYLYDDIEIGHGNIIPLWAFGLLY